MHGDLDVLAAPRLAAGHQRVEDAVRGVETGKDVRLIQRGGGGRLLVVALYGHQAAHGHRVEV